MKINRALFVIAIINMAVTGLQAQNLKDFNGKVYQTKLFGTQVWMLENLDVSNFSNGDAIFEAKTPAEWEKAGAEGKPAWCYYTTETGTEKQYGKLYNGFAITDPRGLAPKGWHIPKVEEWDKLEKVIKPNLIHTAIDMKSIDGWADEGEEFGEIYNTPGTNESGFNGLPAGGISGNGEASGKREIACWWSATVSEYGADMLDTWSIWFDNDGLIKAWAGKVSGNSVRCVKD